MLAKRPSFNSRRLQRTRHKRSIARSCLRLDRKRRRHRCPHRKRERCSRLKEVLGISRNEGRMMPVRNTILPHYAIERARTARGSSIIPPVGDFNAHPKRIIVASSVLSLVFKQPSWLRPTTWMRLVILLSLSLLDHGKTQFGVDGESPT